MAIGASGYPVLSVILVLLTHHLEEHAAEGLVGSGLRSFQKLSFVPDVASGFSAS